MTTTPEEKVGTPLRYPGGKTRALEQISAAFPRDKSAFYVEPMVGGGSVLFAAQRAGVADSYWINDLYAPVYAFWKTVQDRAANKAMRAHLSNVINAINGDPERARAVFTLIRGQRQARLEDLATNFFLINRITFSGAFSTGGFSREASVKRLTASSVERLEPLPDALRRVKITNQCVLKLIPKIPDGAFVFLDPPYASVKNLYGYDGGLHNGFPHEQLAETIAAHAHRFKFLMTYDAGIMGVERAAAVYRQFCIKNWTLRYSMDSWACSAPATGSTSPDDLVKDGVKDKEWRKARTRSRDSKTGQELFISNY